MGPTVVLRSTTSRVLGAALVGVAVVALLATTTDGAAATVAWGPVLALFGLLGWAGFWRPCVEVSDGGVRVVNVVRTVDVPWPALEEVDGRYGLRLATAYGAVQAWGASAPGGRARAVTAESETSAAVRQRWERLREQGHLDGVRLEHEELPVTWHRGVLAALGLLLVLAVLGRLLPVG